MGLLSEAKKGEVIYLMRHGKTPLDTEHRSDGWLDFPLSDKGRVGLIEAQQYLKNVPLARIYAPTLKRTTESAHIVKSGALSNPKVVKADKARTWNLGTLMGTKKRPNKPIVEYFMDHPEETPLGGESLEDFRGRFLPWLGERAKEVEEGREPVLLVLSGSNLRELGIQMCDNKDALDLDEGGLACLQKDESGHWYGHVLFGHKSEQDEYLS